MLCSHMQYLLRAMHLLMCDCYCGLNIFCVVHQLCCPGSTARRCCLTKCWGSLGPEQASWHQAPGPRAILTSQRLNPKCSHSFSPKLSFHAVFENIWCPEKKKAWPASQTRNILIMSIFLIATQMAKTHLTGLAMVGGGFGLDSGLWGFISGPLQSTRLLRGEWLHGGWVKLVSPIWGHRRSAPRMGERWEGTREILSIF